jgi:hypothetical protein
MDGRLARRSVRKSSIATISGIATKCSTEANSKRVGHFENMENDMTTFVVVEHHFTKPLIEQILNI